MNPISHRDWLNIFGATGLVGGISSGHGVALSLRHLPPSHTGVDSEDLKNHNNVSSQPDSRIDI